MQAVWSDEFNTYIYPQDMISTYMDKNGCKKYNHNKGPQYTEKVLKTIRPFVEDMLFYKKDSSFTIDELFSVYEEYCKVNNFITLMKTKFTVTFKRYVLRDRKIENLLISKYRRRSPSGSYTTAYRIHNIGVKGK